MSYDDSNHELKYVDVETVEGAKVWLKTFYEK